MSWRAWVAGGSPCKALLLALAAWSTPGDAEASEGAAAPVVCQDGRCRKGCIGHQSQGRIPAAGPLGYGPPGIYPGFQGYGLGYHLGYGYGGERLGTPDGGYPFYGGPGYPHPAPRLRRIGGINPFPHYAGPGFPTPDHPNYYGETGPLVVDQPVISTDGDHNDAGVANSFGAFTGALPYPDSAFAPFTSDASGVRLEMNPNGASPRVIPDPDRKPSEPLNPSSRNEDRNDSMLPDRELGFDQEPIPGTDARRGRKVSRVEPGSEAAKAGLRVGDVIRSVNGYTNSEPGNLPWVLLHALSDRTLRLKVQGPDNADERTLTIPLGLTVAGGRSSDTVDR